MADGEAMDASFEAAMKFSAFAPAVHSRNIAHYTAERAKLKANDRQRVLSVKLSQLQEAQAKEEEKKLNTLALSAWRTTASRQKEKRLEAELEQQQLKSAVLCQAELIRHLNALLIMSAPMQSLTPCARPVSSQETQGTLLFKTFVCELGSLYAKTDALVDGVQCDLFPPNSFALQRKWNPDKTLLESADATQILFSFDQIWRLLSYVYLSDPKSGGTTTLAIYNAVRRYVEKDCVVFVWRVLFEGKGESDGLHSDEHAWLVIRPSDSPDGPAMMLQSYTQLKLTNLDDQMGSNDSRSNQFVRLLGILDEEDLADVGQAMQGLLIGDSQSGSSSDVGQAMQGLLIGDSQSGSSSDSDMMEL
ncbi:hypothetical protein JG688_00014830 [Phytophthora aleatoria]|uniref:Uncharacterized protein n=1 Tax=Phytophthora aleatoria TaxID=2496075 RepID=A0A8J5LXA8_9STRA|nr:hypothetical protein JG688_00014830 [Phytophthora aleatoria]